MHDPLLIDQDRRGVVTLTLNRPEQHNALNRGLIAALTETAASLGASDGVRAVVLTGSGRSFCSGADLQWLAAEAGHDTALADARAIDTLLYSLLTLPLPTLARVNGPALGGGAGLVACCDIAIAAETAWFRFSETRIGLVPAVIAPYVVHALGPRRAKRYFLDGEDIAADKALDIGLVDRVVAPRQLDSAMHRQVDALLAAGTQACRETKRLIGELAPVSAEAREQTVALSARVRSSAEAREGIRAFLERRKPRWQ